MRQSGEARRRKPRPDPRCPLRPDDPCTLCQYDVTGPWDCPLVYLAKADEDLWANRPVSKR